MSARRMSLLANYVGQLRLYSYADLLLLLVAAGASSMAILQCSALWFAFLIYLDWRHRDRGRARWHWSVWLGLLLLGASLGSPLGVALFVVLAFLYTAKKRYPAVAAVSWLLNGALKGALLVIAGASGSLILVATVVTAIRNAGGDFRDVEKDRADGVASIPIRLGLREDVNWLYPAMLISTSVLWAVLGELPVTLLLSAVAVEVLTYRLTPR